MALITFQDTIYVPFDTIGSGNLISGSNVIDATGEAVATIFRSPVNGDISGVSFRLGSITTGDTISIEIQTVTTASGIPSDTLWATGTAISFSLTTTMANTWQTVSLSAVAAVSIGDMLAIVIKRDDVGGAGNFQVSRLGGVGLGQNGVVTRALAAWTKGANNQLNNTIPLYSGQGMVAAHGQFSPAAGAYQVISAGVAGADEVGNIINLPFRSRVSGYFFYGTLSAASVLKINLYDTDGTTVMASSRLDTDMERVDVNANFLTGHFASATVLAINSNYRIAAFVSVGSVAAIRFSAENATALGAMALGSLCYATSRADAGAWSNDTKSRFYIGVIIDQLDDSAASGGAAGGLAHIIGSQ